MLLDNSQCYKLLGLDESASINEIKNAYRKLALEYHPDKNISAKDGVKFKMISEAYHTLRIKNSVYDRPTYGTEYYTNNKNQQYRKDGFLSWPSLLYSKMHYGYTKYTKNVCSYYLKYKPVFSEYCNKIKKHASIIIYSTVGFFRHNSIRIFFRTITKSTGNLAKIITKTIRWYILKTNIENVRIPFN